MFKFVLYSLLLTLFVRAIMRLWGGVIEGLGAAPAPRGRGPQVPQRGVTMARDPICGTFVVPERAVTLTRGRDVLHFCSDACRDQYRAQESGGGSRVSAGRA